MRGDERFVAFEMPGIGLMGISFDRLALAQAHAILGEGESLGDKVEEVKLLFQADPRLALRSAERLEWSQAMLIATVLERRNPTKEDLTEAYRTSTKRVLP